MARTYTAKVNGHVTYYNAAKLPRPGIITAVTSNTVVTLRVVHSGETHAGITRSVSPHTANSWTPA